MASIGAVVGIGLAYFAIDWLDTTVRNLDNSPPAYVRFYVDGIVLAFTVAATIVAGRVVYLNERVDLRM